ncbi:hypothetical protein TNCV_1709781 [Trichonephila clavipes]|nr:hypothetical protein TNCV_1709781 [Trichonephila clavipes]
MLPNSSDKVIGRGSARSSGRVGHTTTERDNDGRRIVGGRSNRSGVMAMSDQGTKIRAVKSSAVTTGDS